ncbi:MAG: YcgN family cysteine cluster protein [Lentisphaerae bacterium]|nr:YcgN family cysteine cluster protein [Lentisphaerota bacterium]
MTTPTPAFREKKPLREMSISEWESLCDSCARCCVHKVLDDDTGQVHYTNVACRLLDIDTCRCLQYNDRSRLVPSCTVLTPDNIDSLDWLPDTCAYRLLARGAELPSWHPQITGDPRSTRDAGMSVRGHVVAESEAGPIEEHMVP